MLSITHGAMGAACGAIATKTLFALRRTFLAARLLAQREADQQDAQNYRDARHGAVHKKNCDMAAGLCDVSQLSGLR